MADGISKRFVNLVENLMIQSMKKTLFTIIVLSVVMNTALMAQAAAEDDVKAFVEELRVAMIDANKTTLEKLTAADLSYGHSSGQVEDKNTFVEKIVSGKSDFTKLDISAQTVKISGDVAMVRHKLSGETNNDGKAGTINLSVLLVWQKQAGKWKLLARQAVKI